MHSCGMDVAMEFSEGYTKLDNCIKAVPHFHES